MSTEGELVVHPFVGGSLARALVVAGGYAVALLFSGHVVRFFILPRNTPPPAPGVPAGSRFDVSTLIGKCENLIAVTCMIAGDVSGLAIVFAAKIWVRAKEIEKNPTFYLGGTLVNLTWSMLVGGITRVLVAGA